MKRLILLAACLAGGAAAQPARIIGDPAGTGKWPAVAEAPADAPGYTVYRPARWPKARLPIVLWGNGGCRNDGLSARNFLREIASHGYLVVANGAPQEEKPQGTPPPAATAAQLDSPAPVAPDETSVAQLLGAIDWAARSYGNRVDAGRIAVMGHSCGGLQAIAAAADPRIAAVAVFNSGVYNRPGRGRSRVSVTKDDLRKLHTPIAYILGGPTDIAYPNGSDDVARIDHVPVFYGNIATGHGGTFSMTDGGSYARVATAWLQWQLKHDRAAGHMFVGLDCRLCMDPAWTIVRKQFPEKP